MDGQAAMSRDAAVVEDDLLALTLGSIYSAAPAPPPPPPPPSPPPSPPRSTRRRLNNSGRPIQRRRGREPPTTEGGVVDDARPAPFPWATERPARHDSLEALLRRGVTSVEGEARCKRCKRRATVAYDLEAKFREVRGYVAGNRHAMDDRAPEAWMSSALLDCEACGQKRSVWPVIAAEKSEINWVFLLLGQMLGCCTLEQLKYFCKNTGRHRTGAKNRVLYYVYLEMCKQLEPQGPFDDEIVPDGNESVRA